MVKIYDIQEIVSSLIYVIKMNKALYCIINKPVETVIVNFLYFIVSQIIMLIIKWTVLIVLI